MPGWDRASRRNASRDRGIDLRRTDPSESKINEIIDNLKSNNNSLLGREIVKKKKEKILEVFDKAEDQTESRTSIAEKVSEILGTPCNRKLVKSVLDQKRSSKLNKLKKIS